MEFVWVLICGIINNYKNENILKNGMYFGINLKKYKIMIIKNYFWKGIEKKWKNNYLPHRLGKNIIQSKITWICF